MNRVILFCLMWVVLVPFKSFSSVVECGDAYIDTIAIEAERPDAPTLSRVLLVSFKDASGNLYNCGMGDGRYAYLSAEKEPAVFNAMMSIAFMAKANNLPVRYFIISDRKLFSARELSVIQLQSSIANFHNVKQ